MKSMSYSIGVVALLVLPGTAAAQAPDWVQELTSRIAAQIERQANQLARLIEQRVEAQRRPGRGPARGPEFTESFAKTVRIGRNGTFTLENISGDIVVTGGGGDDARIEATKRVRHPNQSEAKTLLSEISIQVMDRNGRVDVRTEYPRRRNWSGGVDFTIGVPRDASVTLRSVSGDVRVTSVNGELRVDSISGSITTSGTRRIRAVKTVSGDVEITNGEADELSGGTVSGTIILNKVKAAGVDAQTVSGDLRLTDVEADHVSLRTVSGDVDYTGRLQRNGRYQLQSHSGDIRVTPTDARGFSLDATTFSGDVRSDYALTLQSSPGNGLARGRRNRSIRGSFGDASATLTLQSFSGDIVLVKR